MLLDKEISNSHIQEMRTFLLTDFDDALFALSVRPSSVLNPFQYKVILPAVCRMETKYGTFGPI